MNDEEFTKLYQDVARRIPATLRYLSTKEDDMPPEDFEALSDAEKFAHIKGTIIDLGPVYYERIHLGLKSILDAEEVATEAPKEDTSTIDGPDECAVPDRDFSDDVKQDG